MTKKSGSYVLSAEVVLRPAHGKSLREMPPVTAERVRDYLPSPAAAEAAMRLFRNAGFEVGPLVGISFSITAPRATFERFFKVRLRVSRMRGVSVAVGKGGRYELPLNVLPTSAARGVEAVTFTPPPDFGPGGAGP